MGSRVIWNELEDAIRSRYPQLPLTNKGRASKLSNELGLSPYKLAYRENPHLTEDYQALGGKLNPGEKVGGLFNYGAPTLGPVVRYQTTGPNYRGIQTREGLEPEDALATQAHELVHARENMVYGDRAKNVEKETGDHFVKWGSSKDFRNKFANFLKSRQGLPLDMPDQGTPWAISPEEWNRGIK